MMRLTSKRLFTIPLLIKFCLCMVVGTVNATSTNFENSYQSAENFGIKLSAEAEDAIQNGVSLSFKCEFARRQTIWFLQRSTDLKEHHFSLMRHALSNRYIVRQDDLDTPHIFRSLAEATQHIATQSLVLLESYNTDQSYSMRLSLNKFDLPGPMRLNAFLSSAWDLDTGWILW